MHDHCSFTHRLTIDHIVESVKLLRPGKAGGANGVMSDSFIHGTKLLYQYILVLLNAMLTHGVSHDDFKLSIIVFLFSRVLVWTKAMLVTTGQWH